MKSLLHLIASPRGEDSQTLKISRVILDRFQRLYPDGKIDVLDLFATPLPSMTRTEVGGKYRLLSGKDFDPETRQAWEPIEAHIKRFQAADIVLISTPMWNFGPPYVLKHYADVILQPRHLFRYTENGVEGLAKGKKVIVASTRGGDYAEGGPGAAMDHLTPWLRTILGFIGIPDPIFLSAQPMLGAGPEVAGQKLQEAIAKARNMTFEEPIKS